jgi:ABC-type multidrug transport system fused ATPase/permease subunit
MQFLLSIACSCFVFGRVSSLQTYSWNGCKQLHEDMIQTVLNAPINLYFDTTPIGRILNRFSKDLQLVETMMCYQFGGIYVGFYIMLSIVIMSIVVLPWIGLFYPFLLVIICVLFKLSIAATKEVSRVESVTKSPLLAFLSESISGASTIRAFDRVEDFIAQNNIFLNKNILAN